MGTVRNSCASATDSIVPSLFFLGSPYFTLLSFLSLRLYSTSDGSRDLSDTLLALCYAVMCCTVLSSLLVLYVPGLLV